MAGAVVGRRKGGERVGEREGCSDVDTWGVPQGTGLGARGRGQGGGRGRRGRGRLAAGLLGPAPGAARSGSRHAVFLFIKVNFRYISDYISYIYYIYYYYSTYLFKYLIKSLKDLDNKILKDRLFVNKKCITFLR
jgi:hypothetical protein